MNKEALDLSALQLKFRTVSIHRFRKFKFANHGTIYANGRQVSIYLNPLHSEQLEKRLNFY